MWIHRNMHTFYQPYPHEFQWTKDHPLEQVIGEPSRPVLTRNQLRSDGDMCMYALTVSTVEPKNVKEAMTDPAWIESMQEELLQFKRLDVSDADHPSHVFKLEALYGLKQAPRAWYDELSTFLLQNHFFKGTIDPTLFIRRFDDDILVIKDKLDLDQNGSPVDATKYRSMIGALMYLTSSRPDIVHATCLCARYQAKPTEKHLKEVKRIFRYLRGTVNTGLWYTKDSGFELTGFLDVDYAGCKDTFKSTFGGTQFLGEKLVSWSSKKQDCMTLSNAKAEYVSLSACCAKSFGCGTQSYGLWLSLQQDSNIL
ncbi:copia protein [Tanacetum coccineum]